MLLGQQQQALLGFAQKLGRGAINSSHRLVADRACKLVIPKFLKPPAIRLAHALVRLPEVAQQLVRLTIIDASDQAIDALRDVILALLESCPMLLQRVRVLSSQQGVFPFLDLLLEARLSGFDLHGVGLAGHDVLVERANACGIAPEPNRGSRQNEQRTCPKKQKNSAAQLQ